MWLVAPYSPVMHVQVNGQAQEVAEGATVGALIERLGLAKAACAAEVNKRVVPKREHATHALRDGDRVELVTLVGGG